MNLRPALTKNEMRPTTAPNCAGAHFAGGLHRIEHGLRGGECECQLLHRRRAGLLQVIGAHIRRVPPRRRLAGEDDGVLDQPQRRLGREHVGAAREVLLDDVVLDRARELRPVRPLLVGHRYVERQQPRCGGVDRHRRIHLTERNVRQQRTHVAQMRDGHADLADLAPRQLVVGVVARLRRQIEGDGEAGLALGQVLAVELIRLGGRRVAGIGAKQPGLVTLRQCRRGVGPPGPGHGAAPHSQPRDDPT